MAPQRKTIAIDFDGVIHQYDKGWYDGEIYGESVPGAFEMMAKLQQDYDLYILTTRTGPTLSAQSQNQSPLRSKTDD